ncbi:MAG: hypothetical protein AAFX07_00570 [Pseudomonadota bacterium]
MNILDLFPRPVFAPDPPPAAPPADPPPADPPATPPTDPPAGNWWEDDKFSPEQRDYLAAQGLTEGEALDVLPKVIEFHRNAEKRLGQPADQLLSRPKEGEDLGEWRRAHAEVFGIPEAADKYTIEQPKLEEGVEWDGELETAARELAHKQGMSGADLQAWVDVFGNKVNGIMSAASVDLEKANGEMMAALEADWGDQTAARIGIAKQAGQAVAEKAGLDAEAMQNLAMTLKPKTGDAGTIKLFHAIGEMMGEDTLNGLLNSGDGGGFGMTAAQARQRLAQINGPEGEMAKAVASNNQAKIKELQPEIERLSKLATAK